MGRLTPPAAKYQPSPHWGSGSGPTRPSVHGTPSSSSAGSACSSACALGLRPRQLSTQDFLLLGAVYGSFALAMAGVYLPIFQPLLGTDSLPLPDLLLATVIDVVGWIAVQFTRRRRGQPEPATPPEPAEGREATHQRSQQWRGAARYSTHGRDALLPRRCAH